MVLREIDWLLSPNAQKGSQTLFFHILANNGRRQFHKVKPLNSRFHPE